MSLETLNFTNPEKEQEKPSFMQRHEKLISKMFEYAGKGAVAALVIHELGKVVFPEFLPSTAPRLDSIESFAALSAVIGAGGAYIESFFKKQAGNTEEQEG